MGPLQCWGAASCVKGGTSILGAKAPGSFSHGIRNNVCCTCFVCLATRHTHTYATAPCVPLSVSSGTVEPRGRVAAGAKKNTHTRKRTREIVVVVSAGGGGGGGLIGVPPSDRLQRGARKKCGLPVLVFNFRMQISLDRWVAHSLIHSCTHSLTHSLITHSLARTHT